MSSVHKFLCHPSRKTTWNLWRYTTTPSNIADHKTANWENWIFWQHNPIAAYSSGFWNMMNEDPIPNFPRRRKRCLSGTERKGAILCRCASQPILELRVKEFSKGLCSDYSWKSVDNVRVDNAGGGSAMIGNLRAAVVFRHVQRCCRFCLFYL